MSNQINLFLQKNQIYARIDEEIKEGGLALWARLSSWILLDKNGSLIIDRCILSK